MAHAPVLERVKTFLLVATLTVLIWVVAESQTLRTEPATVAVELTAGGATDRLVRVAPGQNWPAEVELRLEGSAARVDDLLDELRNRVALRVRRELPEEPGEYTIDLRDALRRLEVFRDRGVTITVAVPEQVRIQIEAVAERELPVRVVVPDGEVDGVPQALPGSVVVRGPAPLIEALDSETAEAVARLDPAVIATLVPGRGETVRGVRVELPEALREAWGVEVRPAQVTASLTIRSKTASTVIPRMPVQLRLAPSELNRWRIEIPPEDQDLINVRLTGPSSAIARITDGLVRPAAVVALSFEELERGVPVKEAEVVGLPAGVQAEVADRAVRLTIAPRGLEEGAGPADGGGP